MAEAADAAPAPLWVALASGGLAGTAVDASLFPIDTIKTRLQAGTAAGNGESTMQEERREKKRKEEERREKKR